MALEAQEQSRKTMKIYLSIVVGQELDGKHLVVKVEKVSKEKEKIEQILQQGKNNWVSNVDTPDGSLPMYFTRNPYEAELEDV